MCHFQGVSGSTCDVPSGCGECVAGERTGPPARRPGGVQCGNRNVRGVKVETVWHGSVQEATDLSNALANNCDCEFGHMGVRVTTCRAHAMVEDQRVLDGLLFARYMVDRLIAEELGAAGSPTLVCLDQPG